MGPVPPRVDARVKTSLLELVDHAVEEGWPTTGACGVLELDERRARRWRSRVDSLDDKAPGRAVNGLLPGEVDAIVELFDRFGDIDRSYRKLAHRGSYEGLVWVSESSVYRVLDDQGLVLPAPPPRPPTPAQSPIPDWAEWRPNQIWIYDFSHFTTAGRVAYAVLDVVSRKWLRTLVTVEESATQVLFTGALDDEGLWPRIEARQAGSPLDGDDPDIPILLAMSDNGPQMRAGTTREFLAMCSIVAHFGRPGTPTDQAWIETLFGHVKSEWPSWRSCGRTTTAAALRAVGSVTPTVAAIARTRSVISSAARCRSRLHARRSEFPEEQVGLVVEPGSSRHAGSLPSIPSRSWVTAGVGRSGRALCWSPRGSRPGTPRVLSLCTS
jgi:putative transposase